MKPIPQTLGELFAQDEAEMLAKARAEIAKEFPETQKRLAAEEARRKTIPVWIVHEGVITGPYANDDAAIAHAEANKWPLHVGGALILDSLKDAQNALAAENEEDDEEDDE